MAKTKLEQALTRARKHERDGQIEQARSVYQSILTVFPTNKRAQKALSQLEAISGLAKEMLDPPSDQFKALVTLFNEGHLSRVLEQVKPLLPQYPDSFNLWNLWGATNKRLGYLQNAEQGFQKASILNPNIAEVYFNLGNVYKDRGKLDDSEVLFRKAISLKRDLAEAYNNLAVVLHDRECFDEALANYREAIHIKPDYAEAYNNLGITLRYQENFMDALDAYQRAVSLRPEYAEAFNNMGITLKLLGRLERAVEAYQKALQTNPNYAEAFNNLGITLNLLGKHEDAVNACLRATRLKPGFAEAYVSLGHAFCDQNKFEEGIASYKRALALKPEDEAAECQMLHQMRHICDWREYDHIEAASKRLGVGKEAVAPFAMLSMDDNAERQMLRSKAYAGLNYKTPSSPRPARPMILSRRLRLGYFSADFHDHPLMSLMLGTFESHDTQRFEVFGYSYSSVKYSKSRERAERAIEHFFDISETSDSETIDLVRSHDLDVAIDLTGYTRSTRSRLFQARLAPIQASYIGYPGTMATDFMDYIIADSMVIPSDVRSSYTENVIYLPNSYLPSDNTLRIEDTLTSRNDVQLPEEAFVFCCFNNNYKVSPREFDIWMRLLSKVERSVLWLFTSNALAASNLRKEAAKRGIDPSRLIFADRTDQAEHLARHKHADLFIDTFNYNAHTTASEALWAGLPLVTKTGEQFAARVAASLLKSIGLPDLITTSEEDYEARILELATDATKLRAIRERLQSNRLTHPLFDTMQNTRDFENGLEQAFDLCLAGKPPQDIWVPAPDR